jgi:hypothetical protein
MARWQKSFDKAKNFLMTNTSGQSVLVWEYFLMAVVLAGFLSTQIRFFVPQKYSQLIVGSLAWDMGAKTSDYLMVLLAIVYAITFYWSMGKLGSLIQSHYGADKEAAYRQLGAYSMIPASLWLGIQLTGGKSLGPIWISAIATIALILFSIISIWLPLSFRNDRLFFNCLASSLLIVLFTPINGIAIALIWGRLNLAWQTTADTLTTFVYLLIGLSLLLSSLVWIKCRQNSLRLYQQLRLLVIITQGLIPFLFLVLLPTPWTNGEERYYGYPITQPLILLIVFLCLWSYIDLSRRFYKILKERVSIDSNKPECSPISFPVLLAVLLYLKTAFTSVPALPTDDYHFGEILLPWWLWSDFSYVPFHDYFPARGLVNYVPGLLTDIFFDGTAAAQTATLGKSLLALPYLTIGLIFLANSIGWLAAFLSLILMPAPVNCLFEIHVILTATLCLLVEFFLRRRWTQWLAVWVVLGIALVLFAPGQGGLFLLGTSPLGAIALYRALRQDQKRLLYGVSGLVLAIVLLALLTPLDQMLIGAVRYGAEQSATNSAAYGIPWKNSRGSNPIFGYPYWEMLRTSWVWVGVIAALLLHRVACDLAWPDRRRYIAFAIPIVLFSILWIPRAAGRIDPASWSRLGVASTWFVCLLLPIVLLIALGHRHKATVLLVVAGIGGLVSTFPSNHNVFSLEQVLQFPTQIPFIQDGALTDGRALRLPNLGKVIMEPSQRQRLQTIKAVLDLTLEPGETYLDMTNRNAQYFYLNFPPPVESGAVYNLVHDSQQIRAIKDLESAQPPVVLTDADSILHDGGTAALRSHLLYRYVVDHYIPVQIESYIFMVRPDRLSRLRPESITPLKNPQSYQLLLANRDGRYAYRSIVQINNLVENLEQVTSLPQADPVVTDPGVNLDTVSLGSEQPLPSNLEIKGTRDFDGDRQTDWLVFNPETMQLEVWLLKDTSVTEVRPLPPLGPDWNAVGITSNPTTLATYMSSPEEITLNATGMALLDQAFWVRDLKAIPSSWGRSLDTLLSELELVQDIGLGKTSNLNDIKVVAPNRYQTIGDHPRLRLDLSALHLSGADAGILVFDFACESNRRSTGLRLHWTSDESERLMDDTAGMQFVARKGPQVVPLDAAPRWLTAKHLKTLEIEVADPAACPNFTLSNVRLFQRRTIAQVAQITS